MINVTNKMQEFWLYMTTEYQFDQPIDFPWIIQKIFIHVFMVRKILQNGWDRYLMKWMKFLKLHTNTLLIMVMFYFEKSRNLLFWKMNIFADFLGFLKKFGEGGRIKIKKIIQRKFFKNFSNYLEKKSVFHLLSWTFHFCTKWFWFSVAWLNSMKILCKNLFFLQKRF